MSSTPQDPYGAGDEPDRSSGSTPPPYRGGDTPPAYGSTPPPPYGSGGTPPAYGSTPPAYGSTPDQGGAYGTPPPYAGSDYGSGQSPYGYGFPRNSLGVWSLVLGLLGIFVCGLFTGIPAIVVGHKSRRAVADGQANNPGLATAGIVLGWIATILSILGIIAATVLIATGGIATMTPPVDSSF